MKDKLVIKGARQHNLKDIDVEIPRNKLVVVTGLSGSGKSSLAFDTIYAEGQRRYVESLSAYARQFLGQMDKPDVDLIEGLSPAISIDQKTTSRNPRSTVGTVTEIYDYLRLLFARVGRPHCPSCGKPITQQTVEQIVDQILSLPEGSRIQVLAPVVRGRKGEHKKVIETIAKEGFIRIRVDGELHEVSDVPALDKNKKHTIEIVVDRIAVRPDLAGRISDSVQMALKHGEGIVFVDVIGGEELMFSEKFSCIDCGISMDELAPRMFSFNSPFGACPGCEGLGTKHEIDPDLLLDLDLSIEEGGLVPWRNSKSRWRNSILDSVCEKYGIEQTVPLRELSSDALNILVHGLGDELLSFDYTNTAGREREYEAPFDGLILSLQRRYQESESDWVRQDVEQYMSIRTCNECHGKRLRPEVLGVTVGGRNIMEVTEFSIRECLDFFEALELTPREMMIARQIVKEIRERLSFLVNVGLDYLALSRASSTLSGGEAQRIRLATQVGSRLTGVLYILDEPSIGLHQRDNGKLLESLKELRDLGNTLIVVEHDEETMAAADWIIDMGPGAGTHGGEVVAQGRWEDICATPNSITGQYLKGDRMIRVPRKRRKPNGNWLTIRGAKEHNLKNVDVQIPLGVFVAVTGVSGSGKSTLINDILYKRLSQEMYRSRLKPGEHDSIEGLEFIDKVIEIDQSPIGRTPRSNPATYTGAFDAIRDLFAMTNEAKMRGYGKGRFSFNVKGGRCEACKGDGILKIEMHFLADVYVPCEVCKGKRYGRETLEVKYKGKSIADVLDMQVEEAVEFFQNIPKIHRRMQTLYDVGLGYIKLGQPATELSGGEAQRVKLATELSRRSNGKTLYLLDEPTTGLHFEDIRKLLTVLERLVDAGDTVVVIEHNLDVIKTADYVIDLGPEGGQGGGTVVAKGTPEEVAQVTQSYTGQFLKKVLSDQRLQN
ncbi:MAG TPA: excinuclease ABC subunit UvrA [Firmicutes bacterium]|nr:excinuclease ABC subunit UvrA [Bacillota bacterium]